MISPIWKTIVYVDGLNFYHQCVRGTPYKWLDLGKLFEMSFPNDNIVAVKIFSAKVLNYPNDRNARRRQLRYFRALRTDPKISIQLGVFRWREKRGELLDPRPEQFSLGTIRSAEEKGTDVNLASRLLADGFRGIYDIAIVVSDDSDLVEPIRIVKKEIRKPIGILNPAPTLDPRTGKPRIRKLLEDAATLPAA